MNKYAGMAYDARQLLSVDQVAHVERLIKIIDIGDPLKTRFQPRLLVCPDGAVCLVFKAPHADGAGQLIDVSITRYPPPYMVDEPKHLVDFVRRMFIDMLSHELDESLYCNGHHVREPHPENTKHEGACTRHPHG